jgi:hypothetical protein
MDLDIGCKRPMRPLLRYDVVVAGTIPVGISNDLMFASPHHPFMDFVIHNLVTFNHRYGTNYPTIMFSTGPMFLSAQYNLWSSSVSKDPNRTGWEREVRVLPKSLYGKNAKPEESVNAFWWHFYGSSWHADDAGFITFLGKYGRVLMTTGIVIVVLGSLRFLWVRRASIPRVSSILLLPVEGYSPTRSPTASRPPSPFTWTTRPTKSTNFRGRGVLFFLPLWDTASSSFNLGTRWTSYLPSFLESSSPASPHRYAPVPLRPTTSLDPPSRPSSAPYQLKIDVENLDDFAGSRRDEEESLGTASKAYPRTRLPGTAPTMSPHGSSSSCASVTPPPSYTGPPNDLG